MNELPFLLVMLSAKLTLAAEKITDTDTYYVICIYIIDVSSADAISFVISSVMLPVLSIYQQSRGCRARQDLQS